MVVGPAAIRMLGHDQSFVLVRTHRLLTHGIGKHLGVLSYIRIGKIEVTVILEGKRTFSLTVRQTLQTVGTYHLHLAVTPFHDFFGIIVSQLFHILLELGATSIAPEDISVTIRSLKHTGVDTVDTSNRLRFRNERTFRTVGYSHTHGESTSTCSRS